MPRSSGFYVENDLTGGVITDFTGLNFPEKSAIEADNVVFTEKSRVHRRLGFDYEVGYQLHNINRTEAVVNSYLWRSVGGNGDISFTVMQVGNTLHFYLVGSGSLSSGKHAQTISLSTFLVAGSPADSVECQFASGDGKLFVTHPYCDPFFIKYSSDTDTFTATKINIKIRDFEGVVDGLAVDTRPTTLTNLHKYNLYNQGWFANNVRCLNNTGQYQNIGMPLNQWDTDRSDFPSNCDVWHYYKGVSQNQTNIPGESFWIWYVYTYEMGNSPAPKGHYLLDVHYQDRSAVSGIAGLPVVSTSYNRVSTVGFFASRVWYTGIVTPGFNQKLYFSQIIEKEDQYGSCHQLNDPTSEVTFDLLPTDGGVISIADAGTIVKLVSLSNALLVFATNGVWSITGSQGIGFTATDYSVNKISSLSILPTTSFVDVNGVPAWMNTEGIYVVRQGQLGLEVQSLTDQKFKKYMDEIPVECKKYARGAYNSYTRVIQWLFRSTIPTSITERYEFDRILNINVTGNSFYPWSISTSPSKVNGLMVVEGNGTAIETENVTDNSDVVVTSNSGNVFVNVYVPEGVEPLFKYIVSTPVSSSYNFSFSETINPNYVDWESTGLPILFDSHFSWGYKVQGEGIKKLQLTYVEIYTDNNDTSTFDLQSMWDYASNQNTGRWSSKQRCQTPNSDYSFTGHRRKLRGHGKAVQLRISSVDYAPFEFIGWSSWITANQRP